MKTKIIFILILLLIITSSCITIIPKSNNNWTCYDYSINYTEKNPEWGIVTFSNNQLFKNSHVVNYKIIDEDILLIHDGMTKSDYIIGGWKNQGFYHFWIDEKPIRNYIIMKDNREILFNEVNITKR